ncbi:MAG: histidine kinase dimerization/phosphoacceptor domain -containing protein [Vulcanimicrobiota bacterium]
MIVDDDKDYAEMLRITLDLAGYRIHSIFNNGVDAIKYIERDRPDIVLMDIVLDDNIDGIEAAGKIKSLYDIPVIYITAHSEDTLLARAKITEPFGYVLKPFKSKELKTVIEMAIYKAKTEAELKKHHEHLEEMVAQRTSELKSLNMQLQNEIEKHKGTMKHLSNSLKEKEILLKEVHHRVKNNLQTVISLLRLQDRASKDDRASEVLNKCQQRIHSMALVHEKLYRSKDLVHIDLEHYMRTLLEQLSSTFTLSGPPPIMNISIQKIPLMMDNIIFCGLIVSELVYNSLKHAKKEQEDLIINVELKQSDDTVQFTVWDNGPGLPSSFDIKNSETLGLQLVSILVEEQLGGHLEVNSTHGAEFKITFKSNEKNEENSLFVEELDSQLSIEPDTIMMSM